MADGLPPDLFNILRDDLKTTREEINQRLDNIAQQSISSATFNQTLANQKERDDRQDARIKELERQLEEQRKTKAQQWFAIGSAILVSVLGVIGAVVSWTILQGIQAAIPGAGG